MCLSLFLLFGIDAFQVAFCFLEGTASTGGTVHLCLPITLCFSQPLLRQTVECRHAVLHLLMLLGQQLLGFCLFLRCARCLDACVLQVLLGLNDALGQLVGFVATALIGLDELLGGFNALAYLGLAQRTQVVHLQAVGDGLRQLGNLGIHLRQSLAQSVNGVATLLHGFGIGGLSLNLLLQQFDGLLHLLDADILRLCHLDGGFGLLAVQVGDGLCVLVESLRQVVDFLLQILSLLAHLRHFFLRLTFRKNLTHGGVDGLVAAVDDALGISAVFRGLVAGFLHRTHLLQFLVILGLLLSEACGHVRLLFLSSRLALRHLLQFLLGLSQLLLLGSEFAIQILSAFQQLLHRHLCIGRLLHGLRLLLSGFGILLGSLGTLLLQLCEAFGVAGLLLLQSGYLFVDLLFLLVNADVIFLRLGICLGSLSPALHGLVFLPCSLGALLLLHHIALTVCLGIVKCLTSGSALAVLLFRAAYGVGLVETLLVFLLTLSEGLVFLTVCLTQAFHLFLLSLVCSGLLLGGSGNTLRDVGKFQHTGTALLQCLRINGNLKGTELLVVNAPLNQSTVLASNEAAYDFAGLLIATDTVVLLEGIYQVLNLIFALQRKTPATDTAWVDGLDSTHQVLLGLLYVRSLQTCVTLQFEG